MVAAVVAAASAVLAVVVVTPATAEPAPWGDRPRTVGRVPAAGTIGEPWVSGVARLQTRSAIAVRVPVDVPARTRVEVSFSAADRRFTRTTWVPAGRSTVVVRGTVVPRAQDLPRLVATVSVRLERRADGARAGAVSAVSAVEVQPTAPLNEGANLTRAQAAARWTALARRLAAASDPLEEPTFGAAFAALALQREALQHGWDDDRVRVRLAALLATEKPDGGYGLATAWDAYGDGTLNPSTTSYTVTSAGHVGWVLLDAYRHGVLPQARLNRLVDAVLAVPRVDGGTCFAYSTARWDRTKPCVYNVSTGAAAWLLAVREATGYRAAEVDAVVAAVRSRLHDGYDRSTGYWAYAAGSATPQDMAHQVYTASSADLLVPRFGAVDRMMARPWWSQPGAEYQPGNIVASSMIGVAVADCRYALAPGVIAGAEQAMGPKTPPFTLLGMANAARGVVRDCFGLSAAIASPDEAPAAAPVVPLVG